MFVFSFRAGLFFILSVLLFSLGIIHSQASESAEQGSRTVDYEQLKIKSYKYWDVYLHENQCYLGRVFVLLKNDEGVEDFLAVKGEAREEFFWIGEQVKSALKTLFNPDKMNYAALSNVSDKIHVHFIPRYQEPRVFEGTAFIDQRWGSNYAPYDRSFALEEAVLFAIRDAFKECL